MVMSMNVRAKEPLVLLPNPFYCQSIVLAPRLNKNVILIGSESRKSWFWLAGGSAIFVFKELTLPAGCLVPPYATLVQFVRTAAQGLVLRCLHYLFKP